MAKRTLENCTLIEKMVKKGLGMPRQYSGLCPRKCDGYELNYETHPMCDKCKLCTSYEEEEICLYHTNSQR